MILLNKKSFKNMYLFIFLSFLCIGHSFLQSSQVKKSYVKRSSFLELNFRDPQIPEIHLLFDLQILQRDSKVINFCKKLSSQERENFPYDSLMLLIEEDAHQYLGKYINNEFIYFEFLKIILKDSGLQVTKDPTIFRLSPLKVSASNLTDLTDLTDLTETKETKETKFIEDINKTLQNNVGILNNLIQKKKSLYQESFKNPQSLNQQPKKSENFEIVYQHEHDFSSVGGYEDVKEELLQVIDLFKNKEKYMQFDIKIPRGILLEGPPGNGKTLLAKGFAGECGIGYISTSGSSFVQELVGVGAKRVRELIDLAKKSTPCIIFIDEIDSIGLKRGRDQNQEHSTTLNELLTAMDGFKTKEDIFFIFSTNRADLLDPALIRPGRIDKKVYVGTPDETTREKIINLHLQKKPHTLPENYLVDYTDGLSAAEIVNVINEAMLISLRNSRNNISKNDVTEAYNRIIGGYSASRHSFTDAMILQIAIHEMGHAIASIACNNTPSFTRVYLNLKSQATPGYTIFKPERSLPTEKQLEEELIVLLAGRAAEQILCKETVTTGARNDLQKVYELAEHMISVGFGDGSVMPGKSDKYREKIDKSIKIIVDRAHKKATKIIKSHQDKIEYYAKLLVERKELSIEDINLT
jgi:cell division protease FtsH